MVENNHWDAPITPIQQGSISKAAIVYEAQVEQITRNMFIFMDLDDGHHFLIQLLLLCQHRAFL